MTILIITDLECTCDDSNKGKVAVHRDERETIEIGAVAFDTESKQIIAEFQSYVKPMKHPVLTVFCKQLTTIKQEDIDTAKNFRHIYPEFEQFIAKFPNSVFACYGNFDFNQFKRECRDKNVRFNIKRHINISEEVVKHFKLKRKVGVRGALNILKLEFQGTPHRGIDDARNIAKIAELIGIK